MSTESRTPGPLAAACLAALALLTAAPARADDGPGAFRIALSTDLVGYAKETLPAVELELGTLDALTFEDVFFGLLYPRFGIELSGVVDPMIVVGVTTSLAYRETWRDDDESQSVLAWTAVAWLELALLPGDVARPFLRGGLGASGGERWRPDGSELQGMLTLSAGAHLFASDDVSIDPFVSMIYRAGERTGRTTSGIEVDRPVENIEVTLGISLSAWLGGRPAEPTPVPSDLSASSGP